MKVLGIDPGTATTGWGVVEHNVDKTKKSNGLTFVKFGLILTPKEDLMENRLLTLYKNLLNVFEQNQPDCVVVEQLFFGVNSRTAMTVGQARGVVMLASAESNVPFFEYQGLQVKRILTTNGHADKKEIQASVRERLRIKEFHKPTDQTGKDRNTFLDDAVDALAIAICHIEKTVLGINV